ncbi:MAG: YbjN domain-containing protein, partial [Bacteroidales bacterium]|nr:YbjN domain-containing protein [Bacteroidales bacterium]
MSINVRFKDIQRIPQSTDYNGKITAEAVARANYGLRVGKFELDCDDGDMRFQVSQILTGDAVGEEVIDRMIVTAINMLDMYLPA